jgi:hypothetical protein
MQVHVRATHNAHRQPQFLFVAFVLQQQTYTRLLATKQRHAAPWMSAAATAAAAAAAAAATK